MKWSQLQNCLYCLCLLEKVRRVFLMVVLFTQNKTWIYTHTYILIVKHIYHVYYTYLSVSQQNPRDNTLKVEEIFIFLCSLWLSSSKVSHHQKIRTTDRTFLLSHQTTHTTWIAKLHMKQTETLTFHEKHDKIHAFFLFKFTFSSTTCIYFPICW